MRTRTVLVWCTRMLVIACGVVLFESTSRAGGTLFDLTEVLNVPDGTRLSVASGINARGDVVGWFVDAGGKQHGFVQSGGVFTPIDFPGLDAENPVVRTDARGIGPGGDIVGTYVLQSEETSVPAHGYLMTRNGAFSRIDHPDHINTIAQRILPNGTILGCYHDADTMGTMHGMIASRDGLTEFDMGMTMHNGATPDGARIVGFWTDESNRQHGYLLEGDEFTSFDVPGNPRFTARWDINARGEIVGVSADAAGKVHGFLVDVDGQFTTIDHPLATTATRVFGINARGDVVGAYVDAAGTHGFIGRRIEE